MAAVPLISVVVPTYQRPNALRRCLRALTAQELPQEQYEVIVIDDGSDPAVTMDKHQIRRLDLTLAHQANQGPAAARNHGARLARGKWLAFTDDDCAPQPSWLCILLSRLEQNPAALVGGRTLNALANNVYAQASQDLVDFLYDYFPRAVSLRPFLTSNNFAADRKGFLELGGFDASFPFAAAEDRDYSERWTAAGGSLFYEPDAKIDHFQALTLKQFFLQHHTYGRGAARLSRVRALRGDCHPRPEPIRFYWQMLSHPFKKHSPLRAAQIAALTALSQAIMVTGFAWDALTVPRTSPCGVKRKLE
jgi:glycosyltransferase involved in cell wall biosynthesis